VTILLILLHVTVCLFLIMVVLLQTGKGADLAGAFGGGGSQTAFGARGATTLLHKLTTGSAVIFMITSLALAIVASRPSGSVVEDPGAAAGAVSSPATEAEPTSAEPLESTDPAATTEQPTEGSEPAGTPAAPGDTPETP
jgi:preprotein translocase subunit SecG